MKKLTFIQCVPSDVHYCWETELQIDNYIKTGYNPEDYRVLVFIPKDRVEQGIPDCWKKLQDKHLNCNFYYYFDTEDILTNVIRKINYIPYLRVYMLEKHFREHSYLKDHAIFYWDSDVLFTKKFDFTPYLDNDICYLSNTGHYLNLEYLEGKIEQSSLKDELREIKPIDSILEANGISKEIAKANNAGVGGAQYLLKNIDADFWEDVKNSCKLIRPYFMNLNKNFFPSENAGWQSWCADMWAVLWNLWKRNLKTEVPKDFDFAWATDPIQRLNEVYLFHNAGVASTVMNLNNENIVLFNKNNYKNNDRVPYNEKDKLSLVDPRYASYFYAQALFNLTNTVF